MENHFKLKISRMFRSSFVSCRTRKISDDIKNPIFSPLKTDSFHLVEPFSSPPPRPADINGHRQSDPRRKPSASHTHFTIPAADLDGRRKSSPPTKPSNIFSECKDFGFYDKKKSLPRKNKNTKRVHVKSKNLPSQESATYTNTNNTYYGTGSYFSSDDDETENFFSSKTRSSDSSESLKKHHPDRRKMRKTRRRRAKKTGFGVLPLKDSFAVVKSSSDPYNDFRTSMVEMIVQRQIFAADDLEELLRCFLSLNSHHHRSIIVEVFTEIWETLFCS